MDLYLMQHGEAALEAEDPERPLTGAGRAAVERVTARAAAAGVRIDRCWHSGKLRAQQTAQVLAAATGSGGVEARRGLAPKDPVGPLVEVLRQSDGGGPLAVVGHLPFLDRLASALVAADEDAQVVRFTNAGLVKLVPKSEQEGFAVAWVLTPELA